MFCHEALSLATDTEAAGVELAAALRGVPRSRKGASKPDLVVVFATPDHAERIEVLRDAVRDATDARHVLGCTAAGLIGGSREIEAGAAVVALAIRCPGATIEPFHATVQPTGEETAEVCGFPYRRLSELPGSACLLFADPFSFPADPVVRSTNEQCRGTPVIGGLASGAPSPGSNRLFVDDVVASEGAVGAVLGGTLGVQTVVSQGCRPIGHHYVITKGKGNVIEELGGESALARLDEVVAELSAKDRKLFSRAVHLGRAIDEYKSGFQRGDFLVRSVIGIDRQKGAVAINDFVRRGQTVQFLIRDPESASEDLKLLLQEQYVFFSANPPGAALLFSCNGRGSHMFGRADHDVTLVRDVAGSAPVSGFLAGGEIGPVGGQNYLHGFTASVAVLFERTDPAAA